MTWIEMVTGIDLTMTENASSFTCGFVRKSDNTLHLCICYPATHQIESIKTNVKKIINSKAQLKKFIKSLHYELE